MENIVIPKLEELANTCLEKAELHKPYSDRDLLNATIIFMEVFNNKVYDYQKGIKTHAQMEVLAEDLGIKIRNLIKEACGVDMHDAAKQ